LARARGEFVQAKDYYDQAIAMDRAVGGTNVRNENHAKTILNRGNMSMRLGKHKEAKDYLEQSLDMFHTLYGGRDAKNVDIAVVLCSLGNLARLDKDFGVAEDYFMQSLGMQFQLFGRDAKNSVIAETLYNIGLLQKDKDEYVSAKSYFDKALGMMVGTMRDDSSKHPLVQNVALELIKIENDLEREPVRCWVPSMMGKKKPGGLL